MRSTTTSTTATRRASTAARIACAWRWTAAVQTNPIVRDEKPAANAADLGSSHFGRGVSPIPT